jgi:regulatory protein
MSSTYTDALKLLARRELSERQVRERLVRKGYDERDIDSAVVRLVEERAIDDRRVAEAIVRTQAGVKRRGAVRILRELQNAGIAPDLARQALDGIITEEDADASLRAALSRRLRGDRLIADDREFQRLYRFLLGQGFASDSVLRALKARRTNATAGREEVD